jgi:hypothetical protein
MSLWLAQYSDARKGDAPANSRQWFAKYALNLLEHNVVSRVSRGLGLQAEALREALRASVTEAGGQERPADETASPGKIAAPHDALAEMFVVGLNHHTAGVDLREKFFTGDADQMQSDLAALGVAKVVVLLTCNRVEVYGTTGETGAEAVVCYLADRCDLPRRFLGKHLYNSIGS